MLTKTRSLCSFLLVLSLVLPAFALADEPEPVEIWPDGAPGAHGEAEKDRPTLHIYPSDPGRATGTAVLICPGGGYGGVAMSYEGHQVAEWFNSFGVTAAVLRYRCGKEYGHPAPMDDVLRAMRYLRARATELGVERDRIGVMGFSAGGHLAATAATLYMKGNPHAKDPIDRESSRPDFAILAYPVITMKKSFTHSGSRRNLIGENPSEDYILALSLENRVRRSSPPTFLFHTDVDTGVPPENSLVFYQALRKAEVPVELHIYRDGPHGVGLDRYPSTSVWPDQLKSWMTHLSLLPASKPQWIWRDDKLNKERERLFLRRDFVLDGPVKEASIVATAQEQMVLYVNGEQLVDSRYWRDPTRVDVSAHLKKGTNVIVARAVAGNETGAFALQLDYVSADGKPNKIVTDGRWIWHDEMIKGWNQAGQTTRGWRAVVSLSSIDEGPRAEVVNSESFKNATALEPTRATAAAELSLVEGFKAELLYSVPGEKFGSWVAIAHDDKGRIITSDQRGPLYRFSPPAPGKTLSDDEIETIDLGIKGAHGLLHAFDSLYVVVNESKPRGLYRLRDTDGDDRYDEKTLLKEVANGGEHGPHSAVLSPDGKSIYLVCGNVTSLPEVEKSVVPRVWKEDHLLPRQWDPRGHARGRMAPGGFILRMDPDGKESELVAIGYRNEFDASFSLEGELFTFDADMEWDVGTPWYRPTRVNHVISGADFGWRSGTGKWPEYYPDSFGSAADIGPGSPTGTVFGTGANFPERYQRAYYLCDWSYGKLYAVHLEPDGASWKGESEVFATGSPFPVTDVIVHPKDGALYVTTGGRGAQSGVYRITHPDGDGGVKARPRTNEQIKLRRQLEKLHADSSARAAEIAWPHLSSDDRAIRFAARVAVEHRPVSEWSERAFGEEHPVATIEAMVALARHGEASFLPRIIAKLDRISFESLDETGQLALLRAYGLAFARLGRPDPTPARRLAARLDALYPAASYPLNRELSQLLVYLEADNVIEKTLDLMGRAPTQQAEIHYALVLRNLSSGWNRETRRRYFEWFHRARGYRGGASFQGFISNIKEEAVSTLSESEKASLAELIQDRPPANPYADLPQPKGPGREWQVEDLMPRLRAGLKGRNYANGKTMFAAASCFVCHRFDSQGGNVGPDLSGVGGRYSPNDLLESVVDPSKVISDQYESTIFEMRDGTLIVGRVINMTGKNFMVNTNMLDSQTHEWVDHRRVKSAAPSPTSMMPEGLLNNLNEDEVLDLMAYLLSQGDPQSVMFEN